MIARLTLLRRESRYNRSGPRGAAVTPPAARDLITVLAESLGVAA